MSSSSTRRPRKKDFPDLGITSLAVVQRARELGIRKALGSSLIGLVALLVGDAARLVVAGSPTNAHGRCAEHNADLARGPLEATCIMMQVWSPRGAILPSEVPTSKTEGVSTRSSSGHHLSVCGSTQ